MPTDGAHGGAGNSGNSGGGNAGNQNSGGEGGNPNGSGGGLDFGKFVGGLQQDNRQWLGEKGWKNADDLVKSHRELELKLSSRGVQHRPGDYVFNAPTNAKEIGYDQSFADVFRGWAHKLNMDPQAAASLHDSFTSYAGEQMKAAGTKRAAALDTAVATAERELTTKWGDPNNPAFKRSHELGLRAMRILNIDGEKLGITAKHGDKTKVVDAATFQALATVGAAMYQEDNLHGEQAGGINPFEAKSVDTRAQGLLIQQDPDKAEQLIRSLPQPEQGKWAFFLQKQEEKRRMGRR